jgi:hypothetical protein
MDSWPDVPYLLHHSRNLSGSPLKICSHLRLPLASWSHPSFSCPFLLSPSPSPLLSTPPPPPLLFWLSGRKQKQKKYWYQRGRNDFLPASCQEGRRRRGRAGSQSTHRYHGVDRTAHPLLGHLPASFYARRRAGPDVAGGRPSVT